MKDQKELPPELNYEIPNSLEKVLIALNEPIAVYIPPMIRTQGQFLRTDEFLRENGIDPDDPPTLRAWKIKSIKLPEIELPPEENVPRGTLNYHQDEPIEDEDLESQNATDKVPFPEPEIPLPNVGSFQTQAEEIADRLNRLKLQKIRILQDQKEEKYQLPHRYGRKWFPWQRKFMDCFEKDLFLTAANQIGKSTCGAATAIEWSGNKDLWPKLWPGRTPRQIWYFLPSSDIGNSEFRTKWVPDLLPRGEMKNHPWWGWKAEYAGRTLHAVHFNSGCSIYFKYYTQDIMNLQASTVAAIFCDEELPEDFWDELNQRRMNYNGYFRMFFTATIGQKIWFDTMECQGTEEEKFKHAVKMQISLFDCKKYEDGSLTHITDEYIERATNLCKSEAEYQKRVMGRFAVEGGLKYHQFDRKRHVIRPRSNDIPKNWPIYVGVDIGSGGDDGHPSAIQFIAVNPEYTMAYLFDAWLGDKEETVDLDVYERLLVMLQKHDAFDRLGGIFYDYQAKDFGTICGRKGLSVLKAEKSHEIGESVINVLFKNDRLKIFNMPEHDELIYELTNLKKSTAKRHARDDAVDAARYGLTRIPFAWEKIGVEGVAVPLTREDAGPSKVPVLTREEELTKQRRAGLRQEEHDITIEEELSAWGELYDTGF